MTRADEMEALAGRVEAAGGADRTLAKDIFCVVCPEQVPELGHPNGYGWREDDSGWWLATGEDMRCPIKRIDPSAWLTSLDAALTLVPEGWGWTLDHQYVISEQPYVAFILHPDRMKKAGLDRRADAATPALALTAAALRAIASQVSA